MSCITAPVDQLNHMVSDNTFIGKTVDFPALQFMGVFILKGVFAQDMIERYSQAYERDRQSKHLIKTPYHLSEVKIHPDHELNKIISEPAFIKIVSRFFDGHVGSDFIRIVKKDDINFDPVFLHQDTGYQIGGSERYSLFIPLTHCHHANGGLVLYPGTHHLGYLGDVGEIADVLPAGYPNIIPDLIPGDVLIMHSGIWHKSPENVTRTQRVYLEVHIQHANDSSTRMVICGNKTTEWSNTGDVDQLFVDSRKQRIRKLHDKIEQLESMIE